MFAFPNLNSQLYSIAYGEPLKEALYQKLRTSRP